MKLPSLPVLSCVTFLAMVCAWTCEAAPDDTAPGWQAFQAAVAHDDKEALAAMMTFPVEWENLDVRSIPSKAYFLKHFPLIFTDEIKREIAHATPEKERGGYNINWKGRGRRAANSYSLAFKTQDGRASIEGLYEGPRD